MRTIFSIEGVTISLVKNENGEEKVFANEANSHDPIEISKFIKKIIKRRDDRRRRRDIFR